MSPAAPAKTIALACDHRGYAVKEQLKKYFTLQGYQVIDCGTNSEESCDYTDYIFKAAELVGRGQCSAAIGICYTGIGSSIAANKVLNVRASLCKSVEEAELTRQHNDSNMLIIGSGFLEASQIMPMVEKWIQTPFEGGRHERRVNKIREYENQHCRKG